MVRSFTHIIFTEAVYVRLKGLIWCCNGLTNPNNVDKSAGDTLNEIFSVIEPNKPLIIDCKGVSGITDHALDLFFNSIEKTKREVSFINYQKIERQISSSKTEFCTSLKIYTDERSFSIFFHAKQLNINREFITKIDSEIIKKISGYVGRSFHVYPHEEFKPLSSTPIFSNGEFDAAQIVSNLDSFLWTSLKIADEVEKIIQEFRIGAINAPACLLTVSLRSSPIAAAVGLLLGLNIETVDHFGPIFKNNEVDSNFSAVYEYIYIGDFTVGGTEIKVSKTYAHMKNCKLEHAVVIGSVLNMEVFKEFHLHSLVSLKNCCDIVKYRIE